MEEKKRINVKEQEGLFNLIGKTLKKKVECYVIDGTAMMFLNIKETTKDVDIVFKEQEDYETFRKALIYLGAKESKFKIENRQKVSSMLDLGKARFDLFLDYLIYFKLTNTIISRVKEVHEFSNMIVKVVSPEDIILFKSMADRESDRADVSDIIKMLNVNWNQVLEEAELQTKNSEYFFSAFLYNFLIGLKEDLKVSIPKEFLNKLEDLTEKALLEARDRLKQKNVRKKEIKGPGFVQVFYGNGKGKTTSALGTALRACGNNYKVHLVQFMKNGASSLEEQIPGEIKALSKFDSFSFKRFGLGDWYVKNKNHQEHKLKVEEAFQYLKSCLELDYDIIIADEILYAVQMNLLEESQVIDLIKSKPKDKELILTGSHKSFPNIFEFADLVIEVKKIKHPYDKGILARKGIEY